MKTNLLSLSIEQYFPFASSKGSDMSGINYNKIKHLSFYGPCPDQSVLSETMKAHHQFLASGGAGGAWKILQVADLVVGIYDRETEGNGKQAMFERYNLTKVCFDNLEFPFTNFCGAFANGTSFRKSNLSYSLFTDASLENTNFENAVLRNVDFSRSNLSGVSFVNADLSKSDFENCNLTGADFRGARIDTARFPGAILREVQY